jgi:ketosteroid isomerase-like protein
VVSPRWRGARAAVVRVRSHCALFAALALWLALPAVGQAQGLSPQAVDALHAALNAADVERGSELFADDAVVIQPRIGGLPQIYVGQEQIRWWLRNLVAQHAQWSVAQPARTVGAGTFEWTDGFSVDAFRQLGLESVEVKSNAVLAADGRITELTTVLSAAAARSIQLAPGGALRPTEPADPTSALTVLAAALLLGVGFSSGAWTMSLLTRRRQPNLPSPKPLAAART